MKVIVVGTNYGATYLRALRMMNDGLTLVGIVSRGSARSRDYASALAVPHYTDLAQLPDGVADIACVAVQGAAAREISEALLDRGLHVLCEHPLSASLMEACLARAKARGRLFQVNAHFAELEPCQRFLQAHVTAQGQGPCLHYELSVNLRTLYSGLDIVGRALGSLSGVSVRPATPVDGHPLFASLCLSTPSASISMLCQNFASERDDGTATLINHRVSALFAHGNLLLAESAGPVLWFPTPVALPPQIWRSYLPVDLSSLSQLDLTRVRDAATLRTLHKLAAAGRGGTVPAEQDPAYLMDLARLFDAVLASLYPPTA